MKGFTLLEMMIIMLIVGIISAISVPSFLGLLNRSRVNDAVSRLHGALQQAQREAIRKSRSCEVLIPEGVGPTVTATNGCFVTGDRKLPGVRIDNHDLTGTQTVPFSYRGTTGSGDLFTVLVGLPDSTPTRCLVVSRPLGLIRQGDWSGTACTARQL